MDEINKKDLETYFLDFGDFGNQFYNDYLKCYNSREIVEALEFKMITGSPASYLYSLRITGRYRAMRFLSLCISFGIDPKEVFGKFPPKVVKRKMGEGCSFEEADDEKKQSLLKFICEAYDNKS